jgi:hypothetical protein
MEALSVDPQASINGSFTRWDDTLAAYRLFDNPAVTPEAILEPHYQATLARIGEHPVVLILQDTTELDFTKHPPKDAECLNKPDRFGLYDHTHLAVTPEGLPLGVVGTHVFDRSAESLGKTLQRRALPIEEKESYRWLQGYRLASQVHQQCAVTQIVNVADREADMYDIFLEAQAQPPDFTQPADACDDAPAANAPAANAPAANAPAANAPAANAPAANAPAANASAADFVIRSKEDRRTNERVPPAEHGTRYAVYRKVRDEVRASPARLQKTITLSQTPKRAARQADLEIRALPVTMKHPKNRPVLADAGLAAVDCNVVHVKEVNGPGDDTDVEWWLITSLPIESVADIERVIDYYKARWTIEVYFRVLKTGCKVEDIQLETTARLKNCLAFYQIIAWRVLCLTHLNRECPSLPCTAVFTDCEWQSVWRVTTKQDLPDKPPPLSEFVGLLASLGGYNNRRTEPPPGPQPIWVGLRRMSDFALAWQYFGPPSQTYV